MSTVRFPTRPVVRRCRLRYALLFATVACIAGRAAAHDLTPWMGRPATERKHFQGNPYARAGDPQCVSPLAIPAESPHEQGYYVGGGARERARCGEERTPHEGTWGVDYTGILVRKRTNLEWWHGSRYQGGLGSYATDGPRFVHRP